MIQSGAEEAKKINSILVNAFEDLKYEIQSKNRHAFGYQAIHIIVKMDKKFYEIQLRTYAQDIWANLVESLSNGDNTLKYGGNEKEQALVQVLKRLSEQFFLLDEIAHTISHKNYRKKIQEVMQNVLSNRA